MGSSDRSKGKEQLWRKATVHFLLCFVMGFFTGFAPLGNPSSSSIPITSPLSSGYLQEPVKVLRQADEEGIFIPSLVERTEAAEVKERVNEENEGMLGEELNPRKLVIAVTPTSNNVKLRAVLLRRLGNTLKLIAQPILWIVVEQQSNESLVPNILRKSGIMYRHIISKENFSDADLETHHQRNLALFHIEHHRLNGIVLFAELSNAYDLTLFEQIQAVEGFGAWPVAKLSAYRYRIAIQGPMSGSSEVIGWHLKKTSYVTDSEILSSVPISGFAFNSSILWDPERWGRTSFVQDNPQNSLDFVKKEVLQEETEVKRIQIDGLDKVLVWDLHI